MLDQKTRFLIAASVEGVYSKSGEVRDVKCILADNIAGSTLVRNVVYIFDNVCLTCNSRISYCWEEHATIGLIIKMAFRIVTVAYNGDIFTR